MKIFISWSGELSKSIAEIFRKWIPGVIQAAKPYYSPDDITKGTRWSNEISKELDKSKIGIICLTKENLNNPWIMFEAGALSKNLAKSKVCPLLFSLDPSDIEGPLVQFQAAKFSKSEMKKVIKMINSELDDQALDDDVLSTVFNKWWPDLEEQINDAIKKAKIDDSEDLRSERDLLEEVLSLARELSISRKNNGSDFFHPEAYSDLLSTVGEILMNLSHPNINKLEGPVEGLFSVLKYILDQGSPYWGSSFRNEMLDKLERIQHTFYNKKAQNDRIRERHLQSEDNR